MAVVEKQPAHLQMQQPAFGMGSAAAGLAYLSQVDQLIIKQRVELLEVLTGCETRNKYDVLNSLNQQVFQVEEESGFCMRQCCGPNRGFVLHVTDNGGQEVIRIVREFKCCAGCCWCADACCGFIMAIESPPGQVVGYAKQRTSCWKLHLDILDADMSPLYTIWGPCCPCQGICCTADVDFPITDYHDSNKVVAKIAKQWSGAVREMFTDADTFGVTFPMNLDVKQKATIMGTVFLVEFMVFETQKNNNH